MTGMKPERQSSIPQAAPKYRWYEQLDGESITFHAMIACGVLYALLQIAIEVISLTIKLSK